MLGSTAANAATTVPRSVDPLFAAAVLGTSDSRAAGTLAPAGYSMAAAQGGSDVGYGGDNGMWALWVGLGAVAAFIIWDLADDPDDDDDDVIVVPVSP
ncbi:MAG TPA: hypothetical protein VJ775_02765 [Sphingomicrobium sp.]|nr:hypothetical protein [Sphingomicrobium sp.]